ncbi:2OG-Fe(II) oxygenase [Dyella choica]|uniref:2-oxoglutarate-dependent dioxygenase n=1 Tax=Dyella choica TaxID=1927959 RepID=A0A3S0PIF2_9GAMM|nr:2OG-Fe(II) oxygenase [Dyella choica]RUL69171.1 2-oxoglutarate-dependent dioxygenase [Dyella choica]
MQNKEVISLSADVSDHSKRIHNKGMRREALPRIRHPEPPRVLAGDCAVNVSLRLASPVIRLLDGLLSAQECDDLIAQAVPRLQRSVVIANSGRTQVDRGRTSESVCFETGETALIQRLEERIAALLRVPVHHGEPLQVTRYLAGQQYQAHYDWFDPDNAGYEAMTMRGGQRVASLVMYLNTPEMGGGTNFPNIGLTFTPIRGSALYFAYKAGEQASWHAGMPVLKGEKWIATKWLRERSLDASGN